MEVFLPFLRSRLLNTIIHKFYIERGYESWRKSERMLGMLKNDLIGIAGSP